MEITEVRIKLMGETDDRLQGFCSITFDDSFVVRDLKIIEGSSGPFVAMPSRKLTAHCPQCGCKNHLRAAYCNQCGLRLRDDRAIKDEDGRTNAKRLAMEEGIFVGLSAGATLSAALDVAGDAAPGSTILVMLPDTGERYLSTYLCEDLNQGSDDEWLAGLD